VKGTPRKAPGTTIFLFGVIVVATVAAICALAIATPPSTNSGVYSLPVYEEMCSIAYGPPPVNYYIGTDCETPNYPVSMPTTYNLATVTSSQNGSTTTLRGAYFAVLLASGQAAGVSINSSVPLEVYAYFDNRTSFDTQALVNEVAHSAYQFESSTGSKTFNGCLPDGQVSSRNEWYIFQILGGQLGQAATVTFNIQPGPCTTAPPQG